MTKPENYLQKLQQQAALRWYWLLLLLIIIFLPHLYFSYQVLQQTYMPDLHMRIVGSRLLDANLSPYYTQWKPGLSYSLYNPNMFMPNGVNGVTVTPAVLRLQLPLARLPYCQVKIIWWTVMETMLFASLFITCLIPLKLHRQLATVAIGAVFFCYSRNWYLHVYNGQYYVAFALLFSLASCLVIRYRQRLAPLFLFPLAVILRPFFAFALVPWLLKFSRKRRLAFVVSFMLMVGLTVASAPLKIWSEYRSAMKEYSKDVTAQYGPATAVDYRQANIPVEACVVVSPSSKVFGAGGLFGVQHYLNLLNIKLNNPLVFLAMLVAATLALIWFTSLNVINKSSENLFLFSFVLYLLAELFTPAFRNPYNMVQYLGILGVFMHKASTRTLALLIIGLLLNHDFPVRLAYQRELGEALMLLAVYVAVFDGAGKKIEAVK